MLIPDDQRDRANAIQQLTSPAAGVVAPIFAGVLYAAVGLIGVIAIDLFTFAVAVIVVLLIHIPRPAQTDEGRALQGSMLIEAFGGLRFLWKWRTPLLADLPAFTGELPVRGRGRSCSRLTCWRVPAAKRPTAR